MNNKKQTSSELVADPRTTDGADVDGKATVTPDLLMKAVERFRGQWERHPRKIGIDQIAAGAKTSNHSIIRLTTEHASSRLRKIFTAAAKAKRLPQAQRQWADIAMRVAYALEIDDQDISKWVDRELWGLDEISYEAAKIRAQQTASPILRQQKINIHIWSVAPFAFPEPGWSDEPTYDPSPMGRIARLAIRAIDSEFEPKYVYENELVPLHPDKSTDDTKAVRVGIFQIIAREKDKFVQIPIPGWRVRMSMLCRERDAQLLAGKTIEELVNGAVNVLLTPRGVVTGRYLKGVVRDPSRIQWSDDDHKPASTRPDRKNWEQRYEPANFLSAYQELVKGSKLHADARKGLVDRALIVDQAMAHRILAKVRDDTNNRESEGLVDILDLHPEAPAFGLSFQIGSQERDLIGLLRKALIDERGRLGEIYTVGAAMTAPVYADCILACLKPGSAMSLPDSVTRHVDLDQSVPGPAASNALARWEWHVRMGMAGETTAYHAMPSYMRLAEFGCRLGELRPFAMVFLDALSVGLVRAVAEDPRRIGAPLNGLPRAFEAVCRATSRRSDHIDPDENKLVRQAITPFLPASWLESRSRVSEPSGHQDMVSAWMCRLRSEGIGALLIQRANRGDREEITS